jgi:hypothetical protein
MPERPAHDRPDPWLLVVSRDQGDEGQSR